VTAQIIDGKALAAEYREKIKQGVDALVAEGKRPPGLGVILAGDDPASRLYVNMKEKACEAAGIFSAEQVVSADTPEDTVIGLIEEYNQDSRIHGILVQLPLPDHINEEKVLHCVKTEKDVDGFHPENVGALWVGHPRFVPCTPLGVMALIHSTGTEIKGKRAVVVGRSNIVGKPVASLLLAEHATVTLCHSRTADLAGECRSADILVAAVGRPRMIPGDWIKPGAVVIDVGTNRIEENGKNRLVGDVDFEAAREKAAFITPVPGGVGPMTITMLLQNTLESARRAQS